MRRVNYPIGLKNKWQPYPLTIFLLWPHQLLLLSNYQPLCIVTGLPGLCRSCFCWWANNKKTFLV